MEEYDYSQDMVPVDGGDLLKKIGAAAQQQGWLELQLAELELRQANYKAELRQIQEVQLPELMASAGLTEIKTENGYVVKIEDDVFASIPKARHTEALMWLDANGHGKLIKRVFQIRFGRDDEAWARKFEADLKKRKQQVDCERADKVEAQTLKKWCRERLADGISFPLDLFGVHTRKVSKISKKK